MLPGLSFTVPAGQAFGLPVAYHNRRRVEGLAYEYHPTLKGLAEAVDTLISVAPGGASTQKAVNAWADSMRQLRSEDVANAIVYCVSQPDHVNINEILMRPTDQER